MSAMSAPPCPTTGGANDGPGQRDPSRAEGEGVMLTDGKGHYYARSENTFIDAWGDGPFSIRVGRRRYYFTDSDMFGPLLEDRHGRVLDRQPTRETHPFWAPYHMWRRLGRNGKKVGRWTVCRWRTPRPGAYWKDAEGLSHIIADPEWDRLGYVKVPAP